MNRRDFLFSTSALASVFFAAENGSRPMAGGSIAGSALGIPSLPSAKLAELLRISLRERLLPGALRPAEDFDDPVYHVPARSEIESVFRQRSTLTQPWSIDVFDCEDFAYSLKVDFARHRYRTMATGVATPYAVGILWGTDMPGIGRGVHVVNIAVTSDHGILLVDATPDGGGINSTDDWKGTAKYIVI